MLPVSHEYINGGFIIAPEYHLPECEGAKSTPIDRFAGWIGGATLLLIGAIFVLRTTNTIDMGERWWALFLFIPVVALGGAAWHVYQGDGQRLTRRVVQRFTGAMMPLIVALSFLLDLDLRRYRLLFLVGIGIVTLIGSIGRPAREEF